MKFVKAALVTAFSAAVVLAPAGVAQATYTDCPLGSSCSWEALNFDGLLNQRAASGDQGFADVSNDETSSIGNRHNNTGGDTAWFVGGPGSESICLDTGTRMGYVGSDFNDEISLMRVYHSAAVCMP